MPERIPIVVLGPSSRVRGGITSLVSRVCPMLPPSVHVIHVPTFSQYTGYDGSEHGSRIIQLGVYLAALARTMWYSLVLRKAVFHIHLSQRGSYLRKGVIAIWLRCVGARYIVNINACDGDTFLGWTPQWLNRLMLWGLHGADASLTVTERWKKYYAENLGFPIEKLAVLPNPTYPPAEVPTRAGGQFVRLLFLGRMGERKGTFDLIRAFASLPQPVRERCRMMMAGDGEIERARELVRSLGCEDQITLNSWLGPEDVREALAQSDVFVLPSRGEGLSLAVLEAMSWGLAIITSREGGIDEFLRDGHSALLVRAGEVEEIARAIERLATDDELRRSIGRHARRAAIPLDLRHHVDRLVDIYHRVARRPIETLDTPQTGAAPSPVAGTVG